MLPLSQTLWETISLPLTLPSPTPLTKSGSSWFLHIPKFFRPPSRSEMRKAFRAHPEDYHALFVYGKKHLENRFSQFYYVAPEGSRAPDDAFVYGDTYTYSGTTRSAIFCEEKVEDQEFIIQLCRLSDRIVAQLEEDGFVNQSPLVATNAEELQLEPTKRKPMCYYNACLMNWYKPDHSIGLHADDERSLRPDMPIISLSWGGPRRFLLRPKPNVQLRDGSKMKEILLQDGDLLVMGGKCQSEFKHEIPRVRKKDGLVGDRISWTIRSMRDLGQKRKQKVVQKSSQSFKKTKLR